MVSKVSHSRRQVRKEETRVSSHGLIIGGYFPRFTVTLLFPEPPAFHPAEPHRLLRARLSGHQRPSLARELGSTQQVGSAIRRCSMARRRTLDSDGLDSLVTFR